MPQLEDTRSTLPSLDAPLPAGARGEELLLTVIFHPDTARIGASAVVPVDRGAGAWVLGRCSPDFRRVDAAPAPLDDPYVSRRALRLRYDGRSLRLQRSAGASRCRLDTAELLDDVELGPARLRRGVPLLLGHGVVLLLRLGRRAGATAAQCAARSLRGNSARMQALRGEIGRAARSDLDVLIRGETGTGKELVAAAIHAASRRAGQPLVCVNMAAIPEELAPAALFGSARGAYTGAERSSAGYFRDAQGGTLFLDEIGDVASGVQPQLLRALQQREVQSVGGAIEAVDVRVISATDQPLEHAGGAFRAALRHRLGACEIHLPPLREHPEDIGELALYFLRRDAREQGREALLPRAGSDPAYVAEWAMLFFLFLSYRWPGNVRELENMVRQLVLASTARPQLGEHQLRLLCGAATGVDTTGVATPGVTTPGEVARRCHARV